MKLCEQRLHWVGRGGGAVTWVTLIVLSKIKLPVKIMFVLVEGSPNTGLLNPRDGTDWRRGNHSPWPAACVWWVPQRLGWGAHRCFEAPGRLSQGETNITTRGRALSLLPPPQNKIKIIPVTGWDFPDWVTEVAVLTKLGRTAFALRTVFLYDMTFTLAPFSSWDPSCIYCWILDLSILIWCRILIYDGKSSS